MGCVDPMPDLRFLMCSTWYLETLIANIILDGKVLAVCQDSDGCLLLGIGHSESQQEAPRSASYAREGWPPGRLLDCLLWSFQTHRGEFSGINSQDRPWTHLIQCCWVYFNPYDKGLEGGFSCTSIWLLDIIPMLLWWNRKMTCVTGYLFLADVAIPSPFSRAGTRVKQEKCLVHKLERGTHPQSHQGQCSSLPWSPGLLIRVAAP